MNEKAYREKIDLIREHAHTQDDWSLIIKLELLSVLYDMVRLLREIKNNMPDR